MAQTRRESRNRVGIVWFDDEAEADAFAASLPATYGAQAIADASIGFVQVGRDKAFDRKPAFGEAEYAVVTP